MAMVDEYNRGWALRYIREARVELASARNVPAMAQNLVAEAVRKALEAVYHSLGNPTYIRMIVNDFIEEDEEPKDPLLSWLVRFERTAQEVLNISDVERAMELAEGLLHDASEIVKIVTESEERE